LKIKLSWLLVFIFISVIATGCSEQVNLTEVTTRAIAATVETKSYRVNEIESSVVDGQTVEKTIQTEFVAPNRFHEKMVSDDFWIETISIGDENYVRGTYIPTWCKSPCEYDDPSSGQTVTVQADLLPLGKELDPLNWLSDLKQLSDETVDGVYCWHYSGLIDVNSYVDMLQKSAKSKGGQIKQNSFELPDNSRQGAMTFEIWVAKSSFLILQLKVEEQLITTDSKGVEKLFNSSSTKHFYDFNELINIDLPQI
jgi:hypothetical protein